MRILSLTIASTFLLAVAQTPVVQAVEPIVKLDVQPARSVFDAAKRRKPIEIKDAETAAEHFGDEALKKLTEAVDFDEQIVLVFAWRGSGRDKLSFDVAESFPEQVFFRYKPGITRDLRPHVHVFALRSNVKWTAPK